MALHPLNSSNLEQLALKGLKVLANTTIHDPHRQYVSLTQPLYWVYVAVYWIGTIGTIQCMRLWKYVVPAVPARPCACRSAGVSPRVLRSFARRFQLRQEIHFKHSTISCMYTVSQKNYAKLFLSELHQISTNCDNFWQKDGKEANIMLNALIFHITYFVSSHHRVKRRCTKLLHNAVIISIRLLIFASSVQ